MTPLTQIMPSPPHMSHPDVLMSTVAWPAADNGNLKTAVAICMRHGGGPGACVIIYIYIYIVDWYEYISK